MCPYDEDYFGSTPLNGVPVFWRPHPMMNVPSRETTPRRRQPNARSVAIQRAKWAAEDDAMFARLPKAHRESFSRAVWGKPRTKKRAPAKKSSTRKSTAKWTKGRKLAQKTCARDSYRVVKPNAKTLLTLCCPPGKWMLRKKKCRVPLRPHLKRVPRK